jgi:FAD/FMN-containing dehydrogenase
MIDHLEKIIRDKYPDGLTWQKTVPTFHPETADEASDIFRLSRQHGQKLFISGFNNIIDPVGDEFIDLLVLKSDRLNYVKEIAADDFYITVGAGYPLKEINHDIAGKSLWFPFGQTNYPGSCGGAIGIGLTGSDGNHDVPLSRFLLSLTAVLPDGSVVKPGAKTFKSVSGYDISKIFFNSWGLLGMVIELTFRVLPLSKREGSSHLVLRAADRAAFKKSLTENTPLAETCREIRKEYDSDRILSLI